MESRRFFIFRSLVLMVPSLKLTAKAPVRSSRATKRKLIYPKDPDMSYKVVDLALNQSQPWKPIFRFVGPVCGFVSENV